MDKRTREERINDGDLTEVPGETQEDHTPVKETFWQWMERITKTLEEIRDRETPA